MRGIHSNPASINFTRCSVFVSFIIVPEHGQLTKSFLPFLTLRRPQVRRDFLCSTALHHRHSLQSDRSIPAGRCGYCNVQIASLCPVVQRQINLFTPAAIEAGSHVPNFRDSRTVNNARVCVREDTG